MPSNEALISLSRPFRVLIAGASYGGLCAALTLLDLSRGQLPRFNSDPEAQPPQYQIPVEITLVDEKDGYYHLISSPKALVDEEYASQAWTKFVDIPALRSPNVHIFRGSVNAVDCQKKTARILESESKTVREERYDFFIAATGLRRVFPTVPQSLTRDDFLPEVKKHTDSIVNAGDVVVVGGGAVGTEMATELKLHYPQMKVTLIHSRDHLLSAEALPDDFKDRVAAIIRETGVELILGQRVIDTAAVQEGDRRTWQLTLADGRIIKTGHVLNAISRISSTTSYLPSETLNEEGHVKVHPSLQFPSNTSNASHHFAIGDIVAWSGIKRCGGAMHMGHYAGYNIHQLMLAECAATKPVFRELQRIPPMIGLCLGKTAISYHPDVGMKDGEETLASNFGDDMAFKICWNYMRLSEPWKV
ncbi:putative pyridine nucleotide-disulfide oxidoreductase AMID-like [Aspergillus clavatus NRRL 1]|uniref:Pyridine nucleotide-disulphide oxidoreductase, putative n=1 Tax=Aspergillus clavatus (strain ATCC 1007 / CBS 513.65 / DSM 816 / NCTC 3887 / NRRL 1 / QM 1276 / 107) TaxID=344612 RepID=A1CNB0_ASPCL|nr:pyridine nucleotide-disulfide oxidoreductase, putative [Aspergillus clavatus NRRL 1]EAW07131.1 pyridine nucleotide-disulphide oxidoreductase, putative [Aspergillus clavatus NRRL 1]